MKKQGTAHKIGRRKETRNRRAVPGIKALFALAAEQKALLAAAALLMGVSAAATALYAYLLGPMLKTLFLSETESSIDAIPSSLSFMETVAEGFSRLDPFYIGLAIIAAAAVKSASFFGSSVLTALMGGRILHRLRCRMFLGLLSMNPLDSNTQNAGEWTVRFTCDVTQIEEAVTKGVFAYFKHGIEAAALAALALSLDPELGILGLIAFPPAAVLILKLGKKIRVRRTAAHRAAGDLGTAVGEIVTGLPTVHAFDTQKPVYNRFASLSRGIFREVTRAAALRAAGPPLNELLGATALAATLVWASRRIASGDLAPESFISFFSALFLLYQPIKGLGQAHHSVEWGIAALSRVFAFLGDEPPAEPGGKRRPPASITLESASAGYKDKDVLHDLNIHISSGERIAVVGPSGAGKTTLFNLLLGLLPVRDGVYRFNGHSYKEEDRKSFAPVRQEPFLFDDTIIENVRIGAPDVSDKDIEAACRSAGVMEFASSMKDGLHSRVGPFGRALSVGQRQRVCLARALACGAPILLLDEITASIDGETERSVVSGLSEQENRTIVIITHRLSTAKWADRILLIDNGVVAADGPAQTLIRTDPRIAALFGEQSEAPLND